MNTLLGLFFLLQAFSPMFPFQPTHDAPDNITNVATWPGTSKDAAGAQGFLVAKGDCFVDGTGQARQISMD